MDAEPYLTRLTARLLDGIERLPAAIRDRHTAFILQNQNPDGGFPGREGGSDLYYTGFALRSLAVLGALTPDIANRTATFLKRSLAQQASVVDFFSLLVTIPALWGSAASVPFAFYAITGICTVGLYIAYILPVYLRLRKGDEFEDRTKDYASRRDRHRDR